MTAADGGQVVVSRVLREFKLKSRWRYTMFTRSLRGAGVAVFFASLVCAQVGPDGHWEGSFTVNNREMGLSLDLAKNSKSEWIASMGLPSENATGLVVMNVAVNGKSVKFVAVELQMAPFDLTLGSDGRSKGTISSPQGSLPVEFKRTGEAKGELIPASRLARDHYTSPGRWKQEVAGLVPHDPTPAVAAGPNRLPPFGGDWLGASRRYRYANTTA